MSDIGVKIALPGIDVFTSDDPRQFPYWSKYSSMMITKYGSGQVPYTASTSTVTVPHGLGYAPESLRYYQPMNDGRYWLQGTDQGVSNFFAGEVGVGLSDATDRENLTFSTYIPGSGGKTPTVPFRYVLLNSSIFDPEGGNGKPIDYKSSDVGLKISKNGVDIRKAELYQQTFNSNLDFLKFHSTTVLKQTINSSSSGEIWTDFDHHLGYVPLFMCWGYSDNVGQEYPLPIGTIPQPTAWSAFADTSKITVDLVYAASPTPSTINWYVRVVVFENNMLGY